MNETLFEFTVDCYFVLSLITTKRNHMSFGSTEAKGRCTRKPGAKLYKLSWLTPSNHKHLASRAWLTPSLEKSCFLHVRRVPNGLSHGTAWAHAWNHKLSNWLNHGRKIPAIRRWRLLHAHIWLKAWLRKDAFPTAFILKASKAWIEFSSSSFRKA